MSIVEVKLTTRTAKGTLVRSPATIEYDNGRIYFLKSPFALKDEIKAMKGSRWHGYDDENPRKIWSIEDCQRNRFQLGFLMGEDVYAWFDRDVQFHHFRDYMLNGVFKTPMPHQYDLANHGLTYHYGIWAAEMGVGKTLSAQMVIEHSGVKHWYWVGPKSSIPNIKREFRKWGFDFDGPIEIEFLTYEALTRIVDDWKPGDRIPQGLLCDESSRLKGATSQRTKAAQRLADKIRQEYGFDGYVIEMSGTPSPKSPVDWWSQSEIAWPGFLKEGSPKALEQRLGFFVNKQYEGGISYPKRIGWKDDETKCKQCGQTNLDGPHYLDGIVDPAEYHKYEASVNEVSYMHERLKGLVVIKHKKDCLTLPDKRYRKIICRPSASTLRVAKAIGESAESAIVGMTLLRELSDGFQYREVKEGMSPCPHCEKSCGQVDEWFDPSDDDRIFRAIDMLDPELVEKLETRKAECPRCEGKGEVPKMVRIARNVECPKAKALKMLLEEAEETGRIVVFAGFTGSVDLAAGVAQKENWSVVRWDGRGVTVTNTDGDVVTQDAEEALSYWADLEANSRVAFVAHPESGGMSLTLVEARMAVYWSNSFKPEYRTQSEDRIHRKGMDENLGCTIVDLIHLPTDEKTLSIIQDNRKLELMTMGDIMPTLIESETDEDGTFFVEELAA